ncbi:hypothetical protein [Armatimonas rosea]|uniref:Uncharacterized protein n=1 Tax=Armatimonas rosea TaxID=685828 RepID=A0A7W9SR44_ARMRO|nr:hypothetical protein [Armatimonas rosea]MBB6051290.1 hypothetical protein [Armatimonas rosea]
MSDLTQRVQEASQKRFGVFKLAESLRTKSNQKSTYLELVALTDSSDEALRRAAEECLEWFDSSQENSTGWGSGFSVGGVGIGGAPSWQYCAFLRTLKQPDAGRRFQRDLGSKDKVFQLYGLLGLSEVDRLQLQKALSHFLGDYSPVGYQSGCCIMNRPVRELASEISQGRWHETVMRYKKRQTYWELKTKKL